MTFLHPTQGCHMGYVHCVLPGILPYAVQLAMEHMVTQVPVLFPTSWHQIAEHAYCVWYSVGNLLPFGHGHVTSMMAYERGIRAHKLLKVSAASGKNTHTTVPIQRTQDQTLCSRLPTQPLLRKTLGVKG